MLHGTRREVAICFVLLTAVVSVTVYLNVFSLHGTTSAAKLQLKSKLSGLYHESSADSIEKVHVYRPVAGSPATSNQTVKYASDGSFPFNTGEAFTAEELQYHKRGVANHAFNLLISDRIGPVSRPISDTRHAVCKKKTYSNISTSASVIICFHKEAFSTLLRTVASVVGRTPPQLLQEVILVDDFSDDDDENVKILTFLEHHYPYGKVRVVHSPVRLGLIGARVLGAKEASGDVLIFLDSHCEPNVGWIEPLLDRIQMDRTSVVCPVVDIINANTMEYIASPVLRGGFNWGLHFTWEDLPNPLKDPSELFPSPTMAGGLFAVNRLYFNQIGRYDEDMKEWGGENLELSFRIWMCGGKLLISPCSRVGHIFRNRRPNSIAGVDNPSRNAARVAEVWMDDYRSLFYERRATAKSVEIGDLTSRKKLRQDLKCHSFKWFLDTIYPEIDIPNDRKSKVKYYHLSLDDSKFHEVARGSIKVSGLDLCLQSDDTKGSLVVAKKCDHALSSQVWRYTAMGEIKFGADSRLCIDASSSQNPRLLKCTAQTGSQTWKFYPVRLSASVDEISGRLYSISEGLCVQLSAGDLTEEYELIMQVCSSPSVQSFAFKPA